MKNRGIPGILLILFLLLPMFHQSRAEEKTSGRAIMEQVSRRHQLYPYVFEAQTIIMTDMGGHRNVRKMRRYSRVETDGTVKYLLVIDNPQDVRGTALLATRDPAGQVESGIYLPAIGKEIISNAGSSRGSLFLDTDFALEDLAPEALSDFQYVRLEDRMIEKVAYYVVEALPRNKEIERSTGYSLRRLVIAPENFCVIRTEYYDRRGRFFKTQTQYDLKQVDTHMWRANMVLMENHKGRHKTLIKIDRRIFSQDYVPAEIFTASWLFENRHVKPWASGSIRDALPSSGQNEAMTPGTTENANDKMKKTGKEKRERP